MTNRNSGKGIRADGTRAQLSNCGPNALVLHAMKALGTRFSAALCSLMLAAAVTASGQTFEVNQNGQVATGQPKQSQKSHGMSQVSSPSSSGMGWGSSIEVARQARAAQQAIDRGDYASAVAYAERAAKAAPQNTDFWFLLGYTARLAGRYQTSVDAYQHGLKNQPSSINGLSGLAQTYARMGRNDDAKKTVLRVLAANPKSPTELTLAGELFLTSDPQRTLGLLQRADALKPSARTELLMARAYVLMKQPEMSKQMLERARRRAPRDTDVVRAVAGFYRDARQYDLAISTLKSAPSKPPALLGELGYTYQLAGKKKEAADSYAQAADAQSKDIALQLSAAQAFVNAGDSGRANDFLKRAEGIDPNYYRLHAVRGQIASLQNRPQDAIREYELALSNVPEGVPEGVLYPVELRLSLYQLYRDDGDSNAAQRQVSLAQAAMQNLDFQDANRPEFLRLRAALEDASGHSGEAEKDLKEGLSLDPSSVNITLNYANLLWKLEKKDQSLQMFNRALKLDPTNASALSSLGYLTRDMGDQKAAEDYFTRLATLYPDDYVPYLALGDMYTASRQFAKAQSNYEKAHKLAPRNPLVLAGGTNAALEAHELPVAKNWLDRADADMNQNPQLMREHERYLTFSGKYLESAQLGYKVIQKLPRDAEAPVYLAYDLLFLGRYDEANTIVRQYQKILPKDKDLPLIAGYIHVHDGLLHEAVADFTEALEHDPKMATGYMNRGYVLNDLRQAPKAAADFEKALQLRPDYGEAHLGLAYSYLQMRKSKPAIKEANAAEKILGESVTIHLARAEAYRQQVLLNQAIKEYEAAIQFAPSDIRTRLALADAQYRLHRYGDSINTLQAALQLSPNDPVIYAQMAHCYARMGERENTMHAIGEAERIGGDSDRILLATGDALLTLGDRKAAMQRFSRALDVVGGDTVETRLSLARLFAGEGRLAEAREQVALGFAEARIDNTEDITPEHLLKAADVFMSIHDFELAKKYFERAETEGADQQVVAVGLANAYLAQGQTSSAEAQLASLGNDSDNEQNYDYLVAKANVYRQQQDTVHALSFYARANDMNATDEAAQRAEFDLASQEGRQIKPNVGVVSDISLSPIFEDINIYTLDAKLLTNPLLGATGTLLPPPRSSFESLGIAHFKARLQSWPVISGFVEERNARGSISIPSQLLIQDRNTYDTTFNGAINPLLHIGNATFTFTPGLQFTIRRDTISPFAMNQNLFRQFLYISSNSIGNWLSISARGIREAGPFTEQNLHSRDASALLEFTVGRPWGSTELLAGYGARDVLFRPLIREYFTTSSYVGVQHRFGSNLRVAMLAEYLRSWRVKDLQFAIAEAVRPGVRFDYQPNSRWSVQGSFLMSRGQGFHTYDNVQNEFLVSYVKPMRGAVNDGTGETPVSYPLRFSFGLQQQTFYDFPGGGRTTVLPVIRLTLF